MALNIARELGVLQRLTVAQLRVRYAEAFGEATRANNRDWLVKRIAWRLQAQAEGGLSERARRRAEELANDADLRVIAPKESNIAHHTPTLPLPMNDDRLPPAGSIISRDYKGSTFQVKVLKDGFEFEGEVYGTLSAVAKAITGTHTNGFLFFKLGQYGGKS